MRRPFRIALLFVVLAPVAAAFMVVEPVRTAPPVAWGAARVEPAELLRHVEHVVDDAYPRDFLHPDHMAVTARYLADSWRAMGLPVREQRFAVGGRTFANVIASLGPPTTERVVVGAHYDAFEDAGGADDNASGVAALLELGRLLKGRPPPAIGVELVAFALEEPPIFRSEQMGSEVYARGAAGDGIVVRAMLCLETMGYYSAEPGSQQRPPGIGLLYPSRGDYLAVVGDLGSIALTRKVKRAMRAGSSLDVRSINAPRAIAGIDFSDHAVFWAHRVPAVMITDTAFYRNPHYHTKSDRPATLDYEKLALAVYSVAAAVEALTR